MSEYFSAHPVFIKYIYTRYNIRDLRIVLDAEVLAAHHVIALEPLAAPSGVFVNSTVMRLLLMSSEAKLNALHETAISTASFGSSTPHGESTPKRSWS